MNPDAALYEIRVLKQRLIDRDFRTVQGMREALNRIWDLFDLLDGSLSAGGTLPQDWQPKENEDEQVRDGDPGLRAGL